jgi:hypothetical protein
MSVVVRISNRNWQQRVYRCAARKGSMAEATRLCRENGVQPSPSTMVHYNPHWDKRSDY